MLARLIGLAATTALAYGALTALMGMSRSATRATLAPLLALAGGAVTLFAAALLLAIASPAAVEAMVTGRLTGGALAIGALGAVVHTQLAAPPVRSRLTEAVQEVLCVLGLTERRPVSQAVRFVPRAERSSVHVNG